MPQEAWSDKDERQYEHIKQSALDDGKSEERAEELDIDGQSDMNKDELVSAIRDADWSSGARGGGSRGCRDSVDAPEFPALPFTGLRGVLASAS